MKKYIYLLIFPLVLSSCSLMKKSEPSSVSVDDMSAILNVKDVNIDTVEVYLPVFVRQYVADVKNFQNSPNENEAKRMEEKSEAVGNIIKSLEGIKEKADPDFQVTINRYINIIQNSKEEAAVIIKNLLHNASTKQVSAAPSPDSYYVYADAYDGFTNIRTAPNMNGAIIGEILNGGDPALYIGESGNWYKVNYKGTVGYVYNKYATLVKI